jgi:hypothetical protein
MTEQATPVPDRYLAANPDLSGATPMQVTPAWGTGSTTDIAAMYTAAGNLIHEVSPEVLIICEGVGFAADLVPLG